MQCEQYRSDPVTVTNFTRLKVHIPGTKYPSISLSRWLKTLVKELGPNWNLLSPCRPKTNQGENSFLDLANFILVGPIICSYTVKSINFGFRLSDFAIRSSAKSSPLLDSIIACYQSYERPQATLRDGKTWLSSFRVCCSYASLDVLLLTHYNYSSECVTDRYKILTTVMVGIEITLTDIFDTWNIVHILLTFSMKIWTKLW